MVLDSVHRGNKLIKPDKTGRKVPVYESYENRRASSSFDLKPNAFYMHRFQIKEPTSKVWDSVMNIHSIPVCPAAFASLHMIEFSGILSTSSLTREVSPVSDTPKICKKFD